MGLPMSCRWLHRWVCEAFPRRLIARRQQRLAFACLSEVRNRFLGWHKGRECVLRFNLAECLGDGPAALPPVVSFRRVEGDTEVSVGIDVWLGRLVWDAWDAWDG